MTTFTTNLSLNLPNFNVSTWHDAVNNNFRIIDSAIYATLGLTGVVGIWQNSTAYTAGQKTIDSDDNTIWRCLINHTSHVSNDFATDRTNNPTYWATEAVGFTIRGAWTTTTAYSVGDVVYDTTEKVIALCIVAHTSTTDIRTDKNAGKWTFIADIATTNSGVFADPTDATKVLSFNLSGITTATTRTVTWPDQNINFTPDTTYQGYNTNLAAFGALTGVADRLPYFTGAAAFSLATFTTFGRTIVAAASEAAFKSAVNLEIGVDVQAYNASLATYVANPLSAAELEELGHINSVVISNTQWGYLGACTSFGGTLIANNNANDTRTDLGLGTAATKNTGNSGASVIPTLDGNPVFTGLVKISRSGAECLRIAAGGNVEGITFRNAADSGNRGSVSHPNDTSTAYNTSSDYRQKQNDKTVTGFWERILAIRPIDYVWKKSGETDRGFFAHEFQKIYRNSVTGKKDGKDMQTMQPSTPEVMADIFAALQDAYKTIEKFENRIQNLENNS